MTSTPVTSLPRCALRHAPRAMTSAATRPHPWHTADYRRLTLLLLAMLLLVLSGRTHANCSDSNNPGSVTFTPPGGQITLSSTGVGIGTVVWTSSQATPASYPTLNCTGTTNNGVVGSYGSPVGSDETLYPTSLSWLSFRILHPDNTNLLSAYPYNASVPTGNISFSVASALQLVVTGTIPQGQQGSTQQLTIPAGQIAQWNVDMTSSTNPVEIFYITNIQFVIPTCTAAIDPTAVTLSAVTATAFTGVGTTVAQQPFQVRLNCVAGARVSITLSTTSYYGSKSLGVIYNNNSTSPTNAGTGYAKRVGVQILQKNGSTPVTFDTAINEGATPNGTMNLPFFAQYYQDGGGSVTVGDVSATATYTLNYY